MTRKPPLNKNVREGLRQLAALVQAGGSADILGYDEEQLDAEGRKSWAQVKSAVHWIQHLPNDEVSA